jgi:3-hydroxyisobutyrate dehydrogenase-like beta-hydroxyacid dehydrogenase
MNPVGLIGVGAMGSAFVERFHQAGLDTVVYDVSAAALERAAGSGARPAGSPAEVAERSDIVGVMVLNDEQVLDCVSGAGGVLAAMSPGKILLLHSTIHPNTTKRVAALAAERGVRVADACITGRPPVVRAGRAVCILGADDDLAALVEPHLLHLARVVMHMGPLGAGNAAKIVKNMITASERLVIGEGLRVAEAAGVPYLRLLELLRAAEHEPVAEHWEAASTPRARALSPLAAPSSLGRTCRSPSSWPRNWASTPR